MRSHKLEFYAPFGFKQSVWVPGPNPAAYWKITHKFKQGPVVDGGDDLPPNPFDPGDPDPTTANIVEDYDQMIKDLAMSWGNNISDYDDKPPFKFL